MVGGLRTPVVVDPSTGENTGGELIAVFVQKDDSFGLLIKDQGRRIAMDSFKYQQPSKSVVKEYIGRALLFTTSNLDNPPKFEKLSRHNTEEFKRLFTDNQELDAADDIRYSQALYDYAHDSAHPQIRIFNPDIEEVSTEAAHRYLQVTRPNTHEDRELAKSEYNEVSFSFNSAVCATSTSEDDNTHVPFADVKAVYAAFLSPSASAMILPSEEVAEAAVDQETQAVLADQSKKRDIINKKADPPTLATSLKNIFGSRR